MASFVLVAGAWHSARCWALIVARLEALGHQAIAHELPDMGARAGQDGVVGFEDWIVSVETAARAAAGPVVLVGHSRAGLVVSQAAERLGGTLAAAVYVSAILLPAQTDLMTHLTAMGYATPAALGVTADADGVHTRLNPAGMIAVAYDTSDAAAQAYARTTFTHEPTFVMATRLALTDAGFGSVRKVYVECARDALLPLAVQRAMQAAVPCDEVRTLDTDHSPFASDPDGLARVLDEVSPA